MCYWIFVVGNCFIPSHLSWIILWKIYRKNFRRVWSEKYDVIFVSQSRHAKNLVEKSDLEKASHSCKGQ